MFSLDELDVIRLALIESITSMRDTIRNCSTVEIREYWSEELRCSEGLLIKVNELEGAQEE